MTRSMICGLLCAVVALGGCGTSQKDVLYQPQTLQSPYASVNDQVLWAVVPPGNESGTTLADSEAVGDALVAAVQQAQGLRCLPLDRTIAAMQALNMDAVRTPADAATLSKALGVDGLLVSTVTAWNPYDPPTIGLSLALFARSEAMGAPAQADLLDPRALIAAASDQDFLGSDSFVDRPLAVVSEHMDAKNHATLAALREYATGRHDDRAAAGWRRYTMAMPLYTEFAAHHVIDRLLRDESRRVAPPVVVAAE